VHCWNHLKRDTRYWLKNKLKNTGAKEEEIGVYVNHVTRLLDSESESDFEDKLEELSAVWSDPFVGYFNKELKTSIVRYSGRLIVEPLGIYHPFSGITNNASESVNRVLKDLTKWQRQPLD
jgi:hypothetical protein